MALRPTILFWYGRYLTRRKRPARALEVFRAVTQADPRHHRAWSSIGFLLAARQELEPALDAFEQALALDPADPASNFNVAFLLQRMGRHDEAVRGFERALEGDPGLERARRGLELSRGK